MARSVKRQSRKTALLLGVGYTARALIPFLRAAGYDIIGTSRSPDKLKALDIKAIRFDGALTDELQGVLSQANIIVSSIGPSDEGDPFLNAISHDLAALTPNLEWAGYLSATSVYGDRGGKWAFEDELLRPSTARGKARMAAEMAWLEIGAPVHIFRLAGIYGPDLGGMSRNPFTRLTAGTARAVIKPGHIVNRIHAEDIARAVMASIAKPDPAMIYNLADNEPAPPQDVINFAAQIMDVPKPKQIGYDSKELSEMARSFYSESKRVSNQKAKQDLGWTPQYPNYRKGLMSVYKASQDNPHLVMLSGRVTVADADMAAFKEGLKSHIALTRAEPGCQRFDVIQDKDAPNKFHVFEIFGSPQAFDAHQRRAAYSDWADISRNVKRQYDRVGLT